MEIEYTSHFINSYKKSDPSIQKKAEKREVIFRKNPFAPILKTHKLQGQLKEFYSFSIDFRFHIIFKFISSKKALFLDVGDHAIYH